MSSKGCVSMRQYQVWLERKSYSQHLDNLMKIREGKLSWRREDEVAVKKNIKDKSLDSSNVQCLFESRTMLKSHSLKKQNLAMIKRIAQTKPVISAKKHNIFYKSYHHLLSKKAPLKVDEIKGENLKRFFKFERERQLHQGAESVIKLYFTEITKIISHPEKSQVWCEVIGLGIRFKTRLVDASKLDSQAFYIPFRDQPPTKLMVKVYTCCNLDSWMLGQFPMEVPTSDEKSVQQVTCMRDENCRATVRIQATKSDQYELVSFR